MKKLVTRFTCDAPDCPDAVDVEAAAGDTATLQRLDAPATLPEGWIELQVTGSSPGGERQLVHASKPECAAALAEDQVVKAVEAGEQLAKEEEEAREKAEKATEEAQKATAENEAEQPAGGAQTS